MEALQSACLMTDKDMGGTQILPNLIIAGVSKCGTTSLFSYLSLHPDICGSQVKETLHFVPLVYEEVPIPSLISYSQFFRHCGDSRYVMESGAEYFHGCARVARTLKDSLGDVSIILMFRNPVRRFISYYQHMITHRNLSPKTSIVEYLEQCESILLEDRRDILRTGVYGALGGGFYDEFFSVWLETFAENLKVVFLEDLAVNRKAFLTDIAMWLEIDALLFPFEKMKIENKSVNYRNSALQSIALLLNDQLERFWRSHMLLKQHLRRYYYYINGSNKNDPVPEEVLRYLTRLYAPHNARFRDILLKSGYDKLPAWLG